MSKRKTTEEFIKQAKATHGDLYDYSKAEYTGAYDKITITCRTHGDFLTNPRTHSNKGTGCPKCASDINAKKKNSNFCNNFIEKAKEVHGDLYDYSHVKCSDSKTKVSIGCSIHGIFLQNPSNHLQANGCPKCSNQYTMTTEEFIQAAKEVHEGRYDYSQTTYVDSYHKVTILCKEHGPFTQMPTSHVSAGRGCPTCGIIQQSLTQTHKFCSRFIEQAKKVHGSLYDYSHVVCKGAKVKVVIGCKKHGLFTQNASNHLNGQGCPECGQLKAAVGQTYTTKEFIEKAKAKFGNMYDYSDVDYISSNTKINIRCIKHDKVFQQVPSSHLAGKVGCKSCSCVGTSKGEQELFEYINSLVPAVANYKYSTKEWDVYIPSLNIAFEFDGLYWHSTQYKSKSYHIDKTLEAAKLGVQLIHIFENEWEHKKDIIKSIISYKLGKSKVVYARKTKVVEVSSKESSEFLNANHRQGAVGGAVRLALVDDNEQIIALMTFGKSRFNKGFGYELIRFCNLLNTTVVGGASKLLKYFERVYKPDNLISYADARYSDGGLYRTLGFDERNLAKPNYWYFKSNSLILESRVKYQKHKLPEKLDVFDINLTEVKNMLNNDYLRIYDCGNFVFTKKYLI